MASPNAPAWRIAALSDTGRVRAHNEDSCGTFENASGTRLFVVADGMGGHRGGATASRVAVDALAAELEAAEDASGAWLAAAIRAANREVYDRAENNPELSGMGTTLVAVLVAANGDGWVGHVGDSRVYRLHDGNLKALTEDHSVVAEMIRRGLITPAEAETHPRRNEILRSVGIEPDVEPDVRNLELQSGDRVLLCSDGLCGVVPDKQLEQLLAGHDPDEAVERLIEAANERGGPDNVTAVVAEVPARRAAGLSRDSGGSTLALALLVAFVAALGAFALQIWN